MTKKKSKLYAYIHTDGTSACAFTIHYSQFAAEKKYGDLSKHYKGTSYSDYYLEILTKKEMLELEEELEKIPNAYINWKEKYIQFR